MSTLYQDDLFGGTPCVTVVPDERKPRRRRTADTSIEAGRNRPKSASQRERDRILAEIRSNGALGRTYHEVADRLTIPLQTVCWRVGQLLESGDVFYPETGWDAKRGRPIHLKRDGRKVLVDKLYAPTYLPAPRSVSDEIEQQRSA
jgi:hypothetical protein